MEMMVLVMAYRNSGTEVYAITGSTRAYATLAYVITYPEL